MKLVTLIGNALILVGVSACGQAPEASSANEQHESGLSQLSSEHATDFDRLSSRRDPHPGRPGPVQPYPGQPGSGPVQPYPGYPQPGQPFPPGGHQPGYPQPGYPQPGYPQPGYPQPGQPFPPGGHQPGYPHPGYPQPGQPFPPGGHQPGYPQPGYPQPGYGFITELEVCISGEGRMICQTLNANGGQQFSPVTFGDGVVDISNMQVSVRARSNPYQQPISQVSLCLRNSAYLQGCTESVSASYGYRESSLVAAEPGRANIRGIAIGGSASGGYQGLRSINVCLNAENRGAICTGDVGPDGSLRTSAVHFGDRARDISMVRIGVSVQ